MRSVNMTKRKTKETVYEYDQEGNVVRKTVTVTDEVDDSPYMPSFYQYSQPVFTPATCQAADTVGLVKDNV